MRPIKTYGKGDEVPGGCVWVSASDLRKLLAVARALDKYRRSGEMDSWRGMVKALERLNAKVKK